MLITGIEGYSVFSNLYLNSGTLTAIRPSSAGEARAMKPIPPVRGILSGEKKSGGYPAASEDWWREIEDDLAVDEVGKRAIILPGITVSPSEVPSGVDSKFSC